jgi:hypothetical protein
MDALIVIGIFMLGAATGSVLSYAQHRVVVVRYQRLVEDLVESSSPKENEQQKQQSGG